MPLQLLQIRKIFPAARGMLANRSFRRPWSAPARGDLTGHGRDVAPLTDKVAPRPIEPVGYVWRMAPLMAKLANERTSKLLGPIRPSEWFRIALSPTSPPISLWRKGVIQNGCCFAWTRHGLARPPFASEGGGLKCAHFRLSETRIHTRPLCPNEINAQAHSSSHPFRLRETPGRRPSYVGVPRGRACPQHY